jgi:hypothetical protein
MDSPGVALPGFDNRGEVRDLGNVVHRTIRSDYKVRAAQLHRLYEAGGLHNMGIVETVLRADGDLEHRKLVISYPYEWPANMYKDAVLFHLGLFGDLDRVGLTLKDALPNNIVFDSTAPVFVDFLSLVPLDALEEENWLEADGYVDARFAVLEKMLLPFLVLPLLFMARRQYGLAREMLSSRSCNTGGKPPSWRELLPPPRVRRLGALKRYLRSVFDGATLLSTRRAAKRRDSGDFGRTINEIAGMVRRLDVTPPISGYSSYYDEKKEAHSLSDLASFLPKQKVVHGILSEKRPNSVLDIGANTGWYSVLAASLGAGVIALEEDESCVDILYRRAKRQGLTILALKCSFADLSAKIHPMYRPGAERLGAGLVLVLGLVHHLVLGEGRPIEDVFAILSKLAAKTLVLEFIALDDDKIRESPHFFPNLRKYHSSNYNLEKTIEAGRRYFTSVEVRASHPATRTILVFDK